MFKVTNTKEQESEVKSEEKQEECDGRSERAHQQDEGEDEPAHQEESESVVESSRGTATVGRDDVEATGSQDDREGNPETTVGGESSSTESVAAGNLPHTGEELDETTVSEGDSDDDVGLSDTASSQVDQGQDEGGESEGGETERSRVGEVVLWCLVETL